MTVKCACKHKRNTVQNIAEKCCHTALLCFGVADHVRELIVDSLNSSSKNSFTVSVYYYWFVLW